MGRPPDMTLQVFFQRDRPPGFDPASPDPRVKKAYEQLTDLVGHGVNFQFDEALVPKWTYDFDTLFARSIETVTADLAQLKRREPGAFEIARRIERMEFDYDSRLDQDWRSSIDASGKRLLVVITPRAGELVPEGAVIVAAREAADAALVAKYEGKSAAQVAPADYLEYFDYVTENRTHRQKLRDAGPKADIKVVTLDPTAKVLVSVAELAAQAKSHGANDALSKCRAWLAKEGANYLADASIEDLAGVRAAAPGSPFKQAEAAWAAWMKADGKSLGPEERNSIAEAAFPTRSKSFLYGGRLSSPGGGDLATFGAVAFAGFDRMQLAFDVFDEWAAASAPLKRDDSDPRWKAWVTIVSPHRRDRDSHFEEYGEGAGAFYTHAFARDETKKRLLDYVLAKKSEPVTQQVMLSTSAPTNTGRVKDKALAPLTLYFWKGLEPDETQWRVATRVVAEELSSLGDPLFDETVFAWRKYPARRGPLLYVLAQMAKDKYNYDAKSLERTLGAPISADELGDYLDQGPDAWKLLPLLWGALGSYSKSAVMEKHLPRMLSTDAAKETAGESLRAIAKRMCEDSSAAAERTRLHQALAAHAKAHPSDERAIFAGIDATSGSCTSKSSSEDRN
jgi:hypothetical protein